MANTLRGQMAEDAVRAFLGSGFEESIIYTPYKELAKTINAIVERSPVRPVDHAGGRVLPGNIVEIYIANDATAGVTSIKPGFDKVTLPLREGGTAVDLRVTKIIEEDAGMWHLEAQA